MTKPLELIKKARESAEMVAFQKKEQIRKPRQVASAIIKQELTKNLSEAGADLTNPDVLKVIDSYIKMYELISCPSDSLNLEHNENLTYQEINDLFLEWINDSRELMNRLHPAFTNANNP